MKYIKEYNTWSNKTIDDLFNYLNAFYSGDHNIITNILEENSEQEFVIKLYIKFCEEYDHPTKYIKNTFINGILGKSYRKLDVQNLKKDSLYKDFLKFIVYDNKIKRYLLKYPVYNYFPSWFYFEQPTLINTETEVVHFSYGKVRYKGVSDFDKLGITTLLDNRKNENGFMFGFLSKDLEKRNLALNYGEVKNVIKVKKLIRFYHIGDKEFQCVFDIDDIILEPSGLE
jgi:hypothetical protein